jgi:ADP-ribosylglycohydrolase
MCTQTKQTKQQIDQGMPLDRVGGRSNAMAIRNAASFAFYKDEEANVEASRTAMFTHRERTALDGGAFFTRVTHRVIWEGMKPREAIEAVAALPSSSAFVKRKVQQALDKVQEATDPTKALSKDEYVDDKALTSMARLWEVGKTEPIKVGKASPTEGTLPGSVYFIVKYEDDLRGALQANAEVGGDNASRGVAIGMVLGAYHGVEAIPPEWGKGNLVEWESGETLLQKAPLLSTEAEL